MMVSLRDRYSNWVRNRVGIQGYSIDYSISSRIGKHYCPYCNELLQIKIKEQVVNTESEEAKNFEFYAYGGSLGGNIDYKWDVFYCASCGIDISTGDMYRYERELKKVGGNVDFDALLNRNCYSRKKANSWKFYLISCLVVAGSLLIFIIFAHINS